MRGRGDMRMLLGKALNDAVTRRQCVGRSSVVLAGGG